jgi:DNA-binding NarL/FixJ family response regulator/HAMP domain-containing protein
LSPPAALLVAIVPVGALFGLLTSWRLVGRVRRLERATLAVADGDYTVTLPASGRDEVGRLEANFTTMTRQLGSAVAAERQRAASGARDAERARLAREIHDAISQHLFALRMIAAGMRKADPGDQQAQAIERISEEALRDMQALLVELRPASLDGAGLASALQEICTAYHERLGVNVDASLDDVTVPAPVEHALLRITQEACANAVRHGNARRLAVSMTRQDGHVELAVRDTGTGFDPAASHVGSGLVHIRDRVAVVVLTSATDDEHLVRAMHAGATSYLLKTAPAEDVIAAVRGAATGTASLSPELLTRLTQALRRPPPPDPLQPLSPREREVLRLIARGHSNRQIARDLAIGEQTVKTHVRSILTKLGLQDRVQAAIFALRHQAGSPEHRP